MTRLILGQRLILAALALTVGACGDAHPAADGGPGPDARRVDARSDGAGGSDAPPDTRPGPDAVQVQCPSDPAPCAGTCNAKGYCEIDRGFGPEVRIAPSTVVLGDPAFPGEVEHLERVSRQYLIDRHEVTARQYKRCMDAGGCSMPTNSGPGICTVAVLDDPMWLAWIRQHGLEGDHPANCMTWPDALAFCRWRGARLPTEAEWVLAARGAGGLSAGSCESAADLATTGRCNRKRYPWGDTLESDRMNSGVGSAPWTNESTTPVGFFDGSRHNGTQTSFQTGDDSSAFGARDLQGNLREWVSDERAVPGDATMRGRVLKGDAFQTSETVLAAGFVTPPGESSQILGFRCARDAP